MDKIEILIPGVKYEVDWALIESLRYMGGLGELDLRYVEQDLHESLNMLFNYSQERMQLPLDLVLGKSKEEEPMEGRDRHLPGLIMTVFCSKSYASWVNNTDVSHTVASFGYLSKICKGENFTKEEKKIVLSAMIVHDCAYPPTKSFNEFTSEKVRREHMLRAENEFRNFAEEISPGFYSNDEIESVCSIVKQHDNPGIKDENGKPLQFSYNLTPSKLLWAHREADRLWMLDKAGFALDLTRRLLEPNPWYDPDRYLNHVISKHLEEADKYQDNKNCKFYHGKKSLYRTDKGFQIFQELVGDRAREYEITLDPPKR